MVSNEHGVLHFFAFVSLEVIGNVMSVDNLRITSSKSHESHTPAMANEDRNATLRTGFIEHQVCNATGRVSSLDTEMKRNDGMFIVKKSIDFVR